MIACILFMHTRIIDDKYLYTIKETDANGDTVVVCTYLTNRCLMPDEVYFMRDNYKELLPLSFNITAISLPDNLDGVIDCMFY